jgi:hypothetical protein
METLMDTESVRSRARGLEKPLGETPADFAIEDLPKVPFSDLEGRALLAAAAEDAVSRRLCGEYPDGPAGLSNLVNDWLTLAPIFWRDCSPIPVSKAEEFELEQWFHAANNRLTQEARARGIAENALWHLNGCRPFLASPQDWDPAVAIVRELRDRVKSEAAKGQGTQATDRDSFDGANSANTRANTRQKKLSLVPENEEVLKLMRYIDKNNGDGVVLNQLARDVFPNKTEKQRQSLLTQVRRFRKKHSEAGQA